MKPHGLNRAQSEAVHHTEGPLLILAGAGTGKTRVITHRIAHLIKKGVPPEHILALSFTNKAAREVADRVRELVGARAQGAQISTFHSLGLNILKEEGKRIGFTKGFSLLSEGERRSALRQIVKEAAPQLDPSAVGDMISRWKGMGLTAAEVLARKEPVSRAHLASFELYEGFMRAQRAVDFDDLLLLPLVIFEQSEDARLYWAERYRYTMVDEYQDTNLVQFKLLKALVGDRGNVAVVGDDDQAIYGWRGAEVELILRFPDHFPGCRTIVLEENYRSTPVILDAAHAVVSRLETRHPKKLKVAENLQKKAPEPVYSIEAEDEDAEAEMIASAILAERFRTKRPWDHFAVLYRINTQSRAFEQALRTHEIPHVVVGGNRYFDHKEVRDVLSYLKVLTNPRDDSALMRIANVPKRGLGHASLIRLKDAATAENLPLITLFERGENLSPQAKAGVKALIELLREFRARFKAEGLTPGGMEDLIVKLKLRDDVKGNYDSARAVQKRLEILNALPDTVKALAGAKKSVTLEEFTQTVTLDPPQTSEDEEIDAVRLMTLHSAKGLEFPIVYLAGMEEGLLPLSSSQGDRQEREEEERRLCYVGMTRAKERLTLCRASSRKRNGQTRTAAPSRYLAEVPLGITEKGGMSAKKSEEEEKEMATNFFDNIRKMLG